MYICKATLDRDKESEGEREREREREIVHYAAMATRRLHKERSKALKRMSFDGSGEACNKLRRPYEIASIDQH